MRVLFVVPRSHNPKQMYREYPLGVGFVATMVARDGHVVSVLDQNVEGAEDAVVSRRVREFSPDVVGFSVITPNYPATKRQLRALRMAEPGLRMVVGGVHANLFPEDLLRDGADVAVLGEGELTMPALLRRWSEGASLEGLAGVCFLRDGALVRQEKSPQGVELDQLPFVDRNHYNLPQYSHHSMIASRGCPYRCAFCCNYSGTVLTRGVAVRQHQRVIDELIHLRTAFGAKEVFFVDDIFFLKRSEAKAFCREASAAKVGVSWIGQMRADTVDAELGELMTNAGCRRVYFGIESGSEAVLKRAKKGITVAQIREGVRASLAAGLRVKTGWIYGLPGSLEEQYASIDLMRRLRPHEISIHQLIPFPGTPYYENPHAHGIRIRDPRDFESFCYGGLEGNVSFDYLSHGQLVELLETTCRALESEGYVSSDRATPADEYIYTTPLNALSMNVFRPQSPEAA